MINVHVNIFSAMFCDLAVCKLNLHTGKLQ